MSTLALLNEQHKKLKPFREEGLRNGVVQAEEEALDEFFQQADNTLALLEQVPYVGIAAYFTLVLGGAPWAVILTVLVLTVGGTWLFGKVWQRRQARRFPVLLESRNKALYAYAIARLEEFRDA